MNLAVGAALVVDEFCRFDHLGFTSSLCGGCLNQSIYLTLLLGYSLAQAVFGQDAVNQGKESGLECYHKKDFQSRLYVTVTTI